jgi:hypothetical protein
MIAIIISKFVSKAIINQGNLVGLFPGFGDHDILQF